jgi:phosphatidylethanolamine-binding protein (PEBP) family uncharacterized protein
VFTIHALDVRYLELTAGDVDGFRRAVSGHTVATGRLVGTYERPAP